MKIFVSSTCYDLADLRAELFEDLRDLGVEPHFSEMKESEFTVPRAADVNAIEACLASLRDCDVVVFILSQRYGPPLGGEFGDQSATQVEYDEAKRTRKDTLFYVRQDLQGEYSAWKKNGGKPDFKTYWASSQRDAQGLFGLIADHVRLHGEDGKANRNNWRGLFVTSVDLRRDVRRKLAPRAARSTAERLIETGQVPILVVSGQGFSTFTNLAHQIEAYTACEFHVMNVGPITAIKVEAMMNFSGGNKAGGEGAKLAAVRPGAEAARIRIDVKNGFLHGVVASLGENPSSLPCTLTLSYYLPTGQIMVDETHLHLIPKHQTIEATGSPTYVGKKIGGMYDFVRRTGWVEGDGFSATIE